MATRPRITCRGRDPSSDRGAVPGYCGACLTVLTVLEIGVYYVQSLQPVLVPLLIFLAVCKFTLVGMYYMHLHFDSRVFSVLFMFPLLLAVFILFSLIMLLTYLAHHPG